MSVQNSEINDPCIKKMILVPIDYFEKIEPDPDNQYVHKITIKLDGRATKNTEALVKLIKNPDWNNLIFEDLRTGEIYRLNNKKIKPKNI